jgi:hypothetical protein
MAEFNRAHFESLRDLHTAQEPYLDPPRCPECGLIRMPCAVAECLDDVAEYIAQLEALLEAKAK